MHSYEASRRTTVAGAVLTISFSLVWIVDAGLTAFGFSVPSWASVPYVVIILSGVYSIAYYVFDVRIWKLEWLRRLHLIRIPNLDGEWQGYLWSSYDELGQRYEITLHIKQRWSKILIRLDTETSRSESVSATLRTDGQFPELSYRYMNKPKANAPDTMEAHDGTAVIELHGWRLKGEYYTGRGRMQRGRMCLQRVNCRS